MKEISNKKRKKKGFTLIELIIVIAIIAIIGAIAVPNFTRIRTESREKAEKQSVQNIVRITEALLIEEKLTNKDVVTLDCSTDVVSVTKKAGSPTGSATVDDLKEYFKNVKKPQEDGKNGYTIEYDDTTKGVKVTTTTITKTS